MEGAGTALNSVTEALTERILRAGYAGYVLSPPRALPHLSLASRYVGSAGPRRRVSRLIAARLDSSPCWFEGSRFPPYRRLLLGMQIYLGDSSEHAGGLRGPLRNKPAGGWDETGRAEGRAVMQSHGGLPDPTRSRVAWTTLQSCPQ